MHLKARVFVSFIWQQNLFFSMKSFSPLLHKQMNELLLFELVVQVEESGALLFPLVPEIHHQNPQAPQNTE